jgi:membrane-bound lytic murein transglycosylase A
MNGGSVADLAGWAGDDLAAALVAYQVTADLLGPGWPRPAGEPARDFFETRFQARLVSAEALLTGYYEPELDGSDSPTGRYRFPLYGSPPDLPADRPWFSRAEIEGRGLLAGRELVWLDSPLEAFLAQVQGSVRVRLTDGTTRRFGFAARNGHPYSSIGKELVRRGAVAAAEITVDAIRAWADRHPDRLSDLLRTNASFVFFRPLDLPEESGPLGAMQRPVTPLRSLAVDPDHVPLGAPVWIEAKGIARLAIAQDTGSAIKGRGRADLYFGSGRAAGDAAGRLRAPARLTVLLPRDGRP